MNLASAPSFLCLFIKYHTFLSVAENIAHPCFNSKTFSHWEKLKRFHTQMAAFIQAILSHSTPLALALPRAFSPRLGFSHKRKEGLQFSDVGYRVCHNEWQCSTVPVLSLSLENGCPLSFIVAGSVTNRYKSFLMLYSMKTFDFAIPHLRRNASETNVRENCTHFFAHKTQALDYFLPCGRSGKFTTLRLV